MAWGPDIGITFVRNSEKDVTLPNPLKTVYTDSTTLTNGMSVYDNTGTDTGYFIINATNNGFDIGNTYYCWQITNTWCLANEPTPHYIGNVYTKVTIPNSVSVIYNGVSSTIPYYSYNNTSGVLQCGNTSNNYYPIFNCVRNASGDIYNLNNGTFPSSGPSSGPDVVIE